MTSRTYLSIGDVLTLLREEFPDVTISKIRFLESQGLVNPERSPSGYRKFFEHDVERLRWVLRQQREHFLPLKVIRDRLAEGDLDDSVADPVPNPERRNGKVPEPVHAAAGNGAGVAGSASPGVGRSGPPAAVGALGRHSATGTGRTEEQLAKADDEAMARILADASRRAALMPDVSGERTPAKAEAEAAPVGTQPGADAAAGPGPARAGAAADPKAVGGDPAGRAAAGRRVGDAAVGPAGEALRAKRAPAAAAPAGATTSPGARSAILGAASAPVTAAPAARPAAPAAPSGGPGARQPAAGNAGAPAARTASSRPGPTTPNAQPAGSTSAMVTGASLTAEEICSASGLSAIELAGLEGFGLIESVDVAGIATFSEDALTVANLAAEFRVFGIEPRHLRLYRNAVDREMGLIEQVIIPLLRQRNPESRQRAVDGAEVLGTLGQTMRATLLRSALRRHIGG